MQKKFFRFNDQSRFRFAIFIFFLVFSLILFLPVGGYSPAQEGEPDSPKEEIRGAIRGEIIPEEMLPDQHLIPEDKEIAEKWSGPHLGDTGLSAPVIHALQNMRTPQSMVSHFFKLTEELNWQAAVVALDFSSLPEISEIEKEDYAFKLISILRRLDNFNIAMIPNDSDKSVYYLWPDPNYKALALRLHGDGTWRFGPATVAEIPQIYTQIANKPPILRRQTWMNILPDWCFHRYRGFMLIHYFVSAVFLFLGFVAYKLFPYVAAWVMQKMLRKMGNNAAYSAALHRASKPLAYFVMIYVWYYGLYFVQVQPSMLNVIMLTLKPLGIFLLTLTLLRGVKVFRLWFGERVAGSSNKVKHLLVDLSSGVLKFVIVTLGVIVIAQEFGFSPLGIISGMGIGGIAVALAAQQTIANFFGSITILMDQPFTVGDYIVVGTVEGRVESVGLRSTRIRTPADSRVFIPNSQLATTTIDNLGHRVSRRFKTVIGLQYDTPVPLFRAFCAGIRKMIIENPRSRKDDIRVYVNNFSNSSIDIEMICFFIVPDVHEENRQKEMLILGILDLAKELGVSFAFPTRTTYLIDAKDVEYPVAGKIESSDDAIALGEKTAVGILEKM